MPHPVILLLGANGFVGRNVVSSLRESGITYIEASLSTGTDLRVVSDCERLLVDSVPQIIINCAAHVGSLNYVTQQAADIVTDNTQMILALYEAVARKAPQAVVVQPIANCAYPSHSETFVEEKWWDGHLHRSVLSYGVTRRLLWAVGECYAMQHQVRSIYLLVPNMYGPFDSTDPNKAHALNALVSKFVKARRTNQPEIEIWGTGVAIREWLFAQDFGRILLSIIRDPNMVGLTEPINIAQNFGLSVRELVDLIRSTYSYKGDIRYDPSKPDGAARKVMDDRRFRKIFPDFQFTSLQQGLAETISYYESLYPY